MATILLGGGRYQPTLTLHHLTGTGLASFLSCFHCLLHCWSCSGTAVPNAEERTVFYVSELLVGWLGFVFLVYFFARTLSSQPVVLANVCWNSDVDKGSSQPRQQVKGELQESSQSL